MKKCMKISIIFFLILFSLLVLNSCGPSNYQSGGGGILGSAVLILIVIIIVFVLPIYKAFSASKQVERFKTLVFVITFYEWIGWILCITIVGIPIGLGLVLISQSIHLIIEIENNTRETKVLLEKTKKSETQ